MTGWYLIWINPEPWAVGEIFVGRSGGKHFGRMTPNANLASYKEAIKEELEDAEKLEPGLYKLTFYFWRDLSGYISMSDRVTRQHRADATNMQKALEDALQGVLFDNDRDVLDVRSVIVQQGKDIEPRILIRIEGDSELNFEIRRELADCPAHIREAALEGRGPQISSLKKNTWGEGDEF